MLSGLEAVQFFQRSGLPQNPTLFKASQQAAGREDSGLQALAAATVAAGVEAAQPQPGGGVRV